MSSGCYVYAIQRRGTQLPSGVAGVGERPLAAVSLRDLEAVVSEVERETLEASAENVLHHETVVEAVRKMGPAIPARFGTVLSDAAAVEDALRSGYSVLDDDLDRLGDKVEMSLSVLWNPPDDLQPADAQDDESSDAGNAGARYLRARLVEYRRDAKLRDRARQLAQAVNADLASQVVDYRLKILPTPRLALRVAYLMHPSQVGVFEDAFGELRRRRTDVRFLLSGPWPPYSFVTPAEAGRRSAIEGLLS